jgi:hypothetical protein
MVNNSTNIIKTNSDLSPKTIEHKKALTYGIGSPGPELGQEQKRGSGVITNRRKSIQLRLIDRILITFCCFYAPIKLPKIAFKS